MHHAAHPLPQQGGAGHDVHVLPAAQQEQQLQQQHGHHGTRTPHGPMQHEGTQSATPPVDTSNPLACFDRSNAGLPCAGGMAWADSDLCKAGKPHDTITGGPPRAPNEDQRALTYKARLHLFVTMHVALHGCHHACCL